MLQHAARPGRPGATVVECAIVLPVTFLLLLGLLVGGMGIFRYQEVASLAREGARWASVHGGQYAREQGAPLTTASDVYQNAILPQVASMDTTRLSYAVGWDDGGQMPSYLNSSNQVRTNRVRVTVTYQWLPEAYLGGVTLTSTTEATIAY